MTAPATEPDIARSCSWLKLIVSGRSAEHPSPAMPNATMPSPGLPAGSAATARSAAASTNGSTWYARRVGNDRWISANRMRPTVTIAQNAVRAREAWVAVAPTFFVMSTWAQLPFMVSQMP